MQSLRWVLLSLLLFTGLLQAESIDDYSDEPVVQQKVLYLSYVSVPERVFKGEIFSLTVRTLSTEDRFEDINYAFKHGHGYKLLTPIPERRMEGRYFHDTFYFLSTSSRLRTPDLTASIQFSDFHQASPTTLGGKDISVVTLNPGKGFSNILADSFEITNYKTTRYNRGSNIVVFSARAARSHVEAMHFSKIDKQGIESSIPSHEASSITYYVIIPKKYEEFSFTYFNLQSETFESVMIPIIVEEDTVSTQSDLKPTEYKHAKLKMAIAGGVAALSLILFIFRRKVVYLVATVLPLLYIAYAAVPIQYVCVKSESPIYLLPMENGTTFEITTERTSYEVQGSIDGFTKIKLDNNKIGWVNNEDICLR